MDWNKKIQKAPVIVVIVSAVAVGTCVASVMGYFDAQKIDRKNAEVKELESQLGFVDRVIGTGAQGKFLDVTNLVVPRDKLKAPPPGSQYFADAGFYAISGDDHWTFSQSTELDLFHLITGVPMNQLPEAIKAFATLAPIYLWRGKSDLSFEMNGASSPFKTLFPYIYVERIPIEKFNSAIGKAPDEGDETTQKESADKDLTASDTDKNLLRLQELFRGDTAGVFLSSYLTTTVMESLAIPGMSSDLINVQKVANVLYLQILRTFKDAKIQGKQYPQYFLRQELILVCDHSDMVVIETAVPSSDPSTGSEYFPQVTSWLKSLTVLVGS